MHPPMAADPDEIFSLCQKEIGGNGGHDQN